MSDIGYITPKKEFEAFFKKVKDKSVPEGDLSKNNFIFSKEGHSYSPFTNSKVDIADFILECPIYSNIDDKEEAFFEIEWECESTTKSENNSPLTLFLISLFVSRMREIVRTGLKKDYVILEENLNSKVKGRILHGKNLQRNILQGRCERFYCSFQEYTTDIPINRFLKRALVLCKDIIANQVSNHIFADTYSKSNIFPTLAYCLSQMQHVQSETGNSFFTNNIKVPRGKLFRNYEEAINLARIIFRLEEAYFLSGQQEESRNLPDFWIYLPTLFEHYVWGKMNTIGADVQPSGFLGQKADFIFRDLQIVVDAKFKKWYHKDIVVDAKCKKWYHKDIDNSLSDEQIDSMRSDFRELSGFARDYIYFPDADKTIPCVIVYPIIGDVLPDNKKKRTKNLPPSSRQEIDTLRKIFPDSYFSDIKPIYGALGFYKVGLRLPFKKTDESD